MTIPVNDTDHSAAAEWCGHAVTTSATLTPCTTESEWLEARKGGVGASEIGVIMGHSTWTSPFALYWRKKLDWHIPQTEAQRWGHLVEDPIAELFAEEMAELLYIAKPRNHPYSLWSHPDYQWALCTPDRLAIDRSGVVRPVELKSDEGGPGWGAPGTDEVPQQYRCQGLWQAFVFGAPGTYVVRKRSSGKRRMVWYYVPFDADAVDGMVEEGADFLGDLARGIAPDPDGSSATTAALQEINPIEVGTYANVDSALYWEWFAARIEKNELTKRDRALSNKLRDAMGTAQFATTRSPDGFDVIRVKRRVGKRDGYVVAPTTTDELRAVGSGLGETDAGVRGPDDPEAGSQGEAEGAGRRSPTGGAVGGEQAVGGDPEVPPLAVTDLPAELQDLVRRGLDADCGT